MKKKRTMLMLLGMVWSMAAEAAPVPTNQVHEKALEVLRQTIDAMENRPTAPAKTAPAREPKFAEVEQLYLQGKITAREFQKYLEDHKLDPAKLPKDKAAPVEGSVKNSVKSGGGQASASAAPVPKAPPAGATNLDAGPDVNSSSLSDLEKKMDELLRLKAAREGGGVTNSSAGTATNALAHPSAPKTKRDRLDALLKLYIDGKIQEAEYKDKRAKLLAEPD
jgi:hypothetical protein